MKIISKYKDYYDYLVGIYGEDPKLVLDRRDNDFFTYKKNKIQLFIAGNIIDGYCDGDKIYYGEDLEQFKSDYRYWKEEKNENVVHILIDKYLVDFNKIIKKDKLYKNWWSKKFF